MMILRNWHRTIAAMTPSLATIKTTPIMEGTEFTRYEGTITRAGRIWTASCLAARPRRIGDRLVLDQIAANVV